MIVTLKPGEKVEIQLFETDGVITVDYDSKFDNKLTVEADMPDTNGRQGIIYCEEFGDSPKESKV